MKFDFKNLKKFTGGLDGLIWSATMYIDGKKACNVLDEGNGGGLHLTWHSKELQTQFHNHVQSLPLDMTADKRLYPNGYKKSEDVVICELVDNHENAQKTKNTIKRWSKTKTIFTMVQDPEDTYQNITVPFSEKVKEAILKKYGEGISKIYDQDGELVYSKK